MRVERSYEEWEIDVAQQVAQELIWQCEDNNKSYWRYINDHFDGSEEQFYEWAEQHDTEPEPWGTPEEMEMFSSEKEYYEYLDDMMDEQDRALEEAKYRMECDW